MKRFDCRIKSVFAVLSFVAILMPIFCVQGFSADYDLNCTVGVGETVALDGLVSADDCTYDSNFVSVSPSVATALSVGSTEIAYIDSNQKQHTLFLTIKKAPTFVKLNAAKVTLGVGESFNFSASFGKSEACETYNFSTNKPKILDCSENGIITAKKTGKATVTVTTYNGKTATCEVTVKKAPSIVKLNAAKVTLGVGESFNFNASFGKNESCRTHKYSTNKPQILDYSKNGIFTAKKTGTATVTVTTYNGKKATCKVTVLPLPKSISSEKSSYTISIGKTKAAKIIVPKGYSCKTYTYKSSAPAVVSVSKKGKFQGLKVGSAKITVKSKNGKRTSFTVYVNPMNVGFVNQFPSYPTGCEAAAAVQLLDYYGYDVSLDRMVRAIPRENIVYKNGRRYGPDINKKFVGDPRGTYTSGNPGYGAFSPVVTKSLQRVIDERKGSHTAVKITGCSFRELLSQISSGHPAIVWATYRMNNPQSVNSWYIPQANGKAKYFEYPRGTHVMVLTGYSDDYVWITDPILGKVAYDISTFEARWRLLGKQAIVLEKR